MPYKIDTTHKKIQIEDKKNTKLTAEEKQCIKRLYETGLYSQRQLAMEYKVSRRTIVFCIYPERYEHSKELMRQKQKEKQYYDKEKHKEYMQRLRTRRKELNALGKLV